jgi:hypothetical protein
MVDLPRRLTRPAEQEGEVVLAADREQHSRHGLDGTGAATDIACVPDVGAAKSCRRETAAAEMLCHGVDGPMLVAAWTEDPGLESERQHLSECREGQRMQFAAAFRLRHDQAPMLGPAPCPRGSPKGFHVA